MKVDGVKLIEGSSLLNATIDSGPQFPQNGTIGELFYIDSSINVPVGLYVYDSINNWVRIQLTNSIGTLASQNADAVNIDGGNIDSTIIGANSRASANFNNTDITGNLSLSGNSRRLIGDFSNSTLSNRTLFVSNLTNGQSSVGIIPNGTSRISNFSAYNSSDVNNSASVSLSISNTNADIGVGIRGSGTAIPLTFSMPTIGTSITLSTNGNTGFGVTPDSSARIQSSNGINLGNVSNANTEVLDWYEEGTFTPIVIGGTTAGSGTYTTQTGKFQRIGNTVHFALRLSWTAHSGSGTLNVGELPYVSASNNPIIVCTVAVENLNYSNGRIITAYIIPGNSRISLRQMSNGTTYTNINMDSSVTDLSITGFYFV